MKLSREEVLHIALLARLGLAEEEVDKLREQLSNILENFQVLQEVDTTNVPPTAQSIALQNVLRERLLTVFLGNSGNKATLKPYEKKTFRRYYVFGMPYSPLIGSRNMGRWGGKKVNNAKTRTDIARATIVNARRRSGSFRRDNK